jgi:predicted nuclease of restriction endonuclease-like RecB superfamily
MTLFILITAALLVVYLVRKSLKPSKVEEEQAMNSLNEIEDETEEYMTTHNLTLGDTILYKGRKYLVNGVDGDYVELIDLETHVQLGGSDYQLEIGEDIVNYKVITPNEEAA